MKAIVLDIEGTTTPIDFVHKTLFPYSLDRIKNYVHDHISDEIVQKCLDEVRQTVLAEENREFGLVQLIVVLKKWIQEDRKHPALKTLQGLIWEEGYQQKEILGQVYEDVPVAFKRWQKKSIQIGIYSSGSVLAQKLIFKNSNHGDLSSYLSFYFDTGVGAKRESSSYVRIATELSLAPSDILFLSDIAQELAAAKEAGFQVAQIVREGTAPDATYLGALNLLEATRV